MEGNVNIVSNRAGIGQLAVEKTERTGIRKRSWRNTNSLKELGVNKGVGGSGVNKRRQRRRGQRRSRDGNDELTRGIRTRSGKEGLSAWSALRRPFQG